jgi:60 kDa SS-A/Ro ribonucleoprotein
MYHGQKILLRDVPSPVALPTTFVQYPSNRVGGEDTVHLFIVFLLLPQVWCSLHLGILTSKLIVLINNMIKNNTEVVNMARFTKRKSPTVAQVADTHNYAGGKAFSKSAKTELVGRLLASFLQSTFYQSADVQLGQLVQVAHKVDDPLFLAKASVYARNVFGMRSVTHVVAAVVAKIIRDTNMKNGKIPAIGKPWFKRYFDKVVARPDDMVEIMSYFLSHYKKPIPNSLKKGFADAFGRFDRYQLAKYRMEGKELTLRKLAKLVWPTITDKNRDAIADLWAGTLSSAGQTWEAKLSEAGKAENIAEAKATAWRDLVLEGKIAQFALLRNLRNIMQQAPEVIDAACELLMSSNRINDSKILPFRYHTAWNELREAGLVNNVATRKVLSAVQTAFDISCSNVPDLGGRTLIALDVSGSMKGGHFGGETGNRSPFNMGALFAGVISRANPSADLVIFSSDCKAFKVDKSLPVFTTVEAIRRVAQFGGTNFHSVYRWAESHNVAYDRIIFLSDGEAWQGYNEAQRSQDHYNKIKGTDTKLYFFDLAGGKTLQFKENKLFYVPGFSEKVFDLMDKLERGVGTILTEIEAVKI